MKTAAKNANAADNKSMRSNFRSSDQRLRTIAMVAAIASIGPASAAASVGKNNAGSFGVNADKPKKSRPVASCQHAAETRANRDTVVLTATA